MNRQDLIQISEAPPIAALDVIFRTMRRSVGTVKNDRNNPPGPICVVDDDESVRDSLTVLLEIYGFSVLTYSSGVEFLKDDRHDGAKLLVVDQHMPGLDGLGLIAELHRQKIVLPSILITARVDPGITQRAVELGVLAVLEKPFPVARLVGLIHGIVRPPEGEAVGHGKS